MVSKTTGNVETRGKRTGSAKKSRHTKKYWKKGANVEDIEDSIHQAAREKATGGIVAELKDDDIFTIDRDVSSTKLKVTKRQQAALDKITRSIDKDLVTLPKSKKPIGKIQKLPRGNAILKKKEVSIKPKKVAKNGKDCGKYDVWDTDFTPKVDLDNKEAAEHYLSYTKKKQPKAPPKSITSLLPAVEVPAAGASYNPEAEEYLEYIKKIASEEEQVIKNEEKIRKGILPQWEKIATGKDRLLELTEGLHIHPDYNSEDKIENEEEKEEKETKDDEKISSVVVCDRLTKEQKKKKTKAAEIALEEKRRLAQKAKEVDSHNVYRTKQIHKELDEEEQNIEKESLKRRQKKVMEKLTKRQRLGRGEFVDAEEPFLLQEELTGSLRQVKPQGHVLDDRMKSLQRRNVLPIGGPKAKKLKKSLKRKIVEKRSVQEVKQGSRVI